jgi:hypothetical protein
MVERRHAHQPNSPPRVLESWISHNEQHVVTQILAEARGGLTAIGLNSCLTGVTARAVKILVVPAGGLIPGFASEVCGTLASTPTGCYGLAACPPVPDLPEEMVTTTPPRRRGHRVR